MRTETIGNVNDKSIEVKYINGVPVRTIVAWPNQDYYVVTVDEDVKFKNFNKYDASKLTNLCDRALMIRKKWIAGKFEKGIPKRISKILRSYYVELDNSKQLSKNLTDKLSCYVIDDDLNIYGHVICEHDPIKGYNVVSYHAGLSSGNITDLKYDDTNTSVIENMLDILFTQVILSKPMYLKIDTYLHKDMWFAPKKYKMTSNREIIALHDFSTLKRNTLFSEGYTEARAQVNNWTCVRDRSKYVDYAYGRYYPTVYNSMMKFRDKLNIWAVDGDLIKEKDWFPCVEASEFHYTWCDTTGDIIWRSAASAQLEILGELNKKPIVSEMRCIKSYKRHTVKSDYGDLLFVCFRGVNEMKKMLCATNIHGAHPYYKERLCHLNSKNEQITQMVKRQAIRQ